MAISTRKKNIIIAEWKTGEYSFNALAKKHKISRETVRKICKDIPQENAQIVEVGTVYESAKKLAKNGQEIKAIESVVKDRLKVHDISNTILSGIEKLTKGGKAQKVVTESIGEAGSSATIVEYDLQADDYKKLQEAVDKASLTLGVNPRFAPSINIQNNNENTQNNNTLKVEWID